MQFASTILTFHTEDQFKLYLDSAHTAYNLGTKAYDIVSIAFAARTAEMLRMQWSDFKLMSIGANGGRGYRIHYRHVKRQTAYAEDEEYCTITGDVEVQILDEYMDCFPQRDQVGRFFRTLMMKDCRITGTKKKYWSAHDGKVRASCCQVTSYT
jgi:integrase